MNLVKRSHGFSHKKSLFVLLITILSINLTFSQRFQLIENEYVMDSYLNNGIIFMKTKLFNKRHKAREIFYNDAYASWYLIHLNSSSMPVNYQDGRIKVDFKNVDASNHKLVVRFSDYNDYISSTDTIELPYIKGFILKTKTFTVDEENEIDYSLKLSQNIPDSTYNVYNLLDKTDICSCNQKEFKYSDGKVTPIFDKKSQKLTTRLCLMRKANGEVLFDDFVSVNFKKKSILNFSGKNGTKGKNGISASQNSGSGTNGENGTDGENAPNLSVFVSEVKVNDTPVLKIEAFGTNGSYAIDYAASNASITVYAKGGNGGDGGNGGNGADGVYDKETNAYVNAKGGNGGNGGNAGNAGNGGAIVVYHVSELGLDYNRVNLVNDGGTKGEKGKAGSGASADSGSLIGAIFQKSDHGKNGSTGTGASDGISNGFTKIQALEQSEFNKLYQEKINKLFE